MRPIGEIERSELLGFPNRYKRGFTNKHMFRFFRSSYAVPYFVLATLIWYGINLFGPQSKIASAVLGFALVFLVPGYSWVISMNYKDPIEEFVVAVAISVSLVIISLITMNMLLGVLITQVSVFADITLLSVAGLLYWWKQDTINSALPKWARKLIA